MGLGKRNYASVYVHFRADPNCNRDGEAFDPGSALFIGAKSGERKSEVNVCLDVNLFRVRRRHLR